MRQFGFASGNGKACVQIRGGCRVSFLAGGETRVTLGICLFIGQSRFRDWSIAQESYGEVGDWVFARPRSNDDLGDA
jgi:hypothetical protein